MVADIGGEEPNAPVDDDRVDHRDVRQMRTTGLVRIVADEGIARPDSAVAVAPDHRLDPAHQRGEVQRHVRGLRDQPPGPVE